MPKLALAKLIVKDHPKLFTSVEACRKQIVNYTRVAPGTGARPDNHNVMAAKYGTARPSGKSGEDAWKALMPKTKAEDLEPWILPKSIRRVGILSDIHVPYADPDALILAIEHLIKSDVGAVILNGDYMDMATASFHERDPRNRDMGEEIEEGRNLMRMLRAAFPKIPIYARSSNHERRLERYLMQNAQILLGMPEFELKNLLRLAEHGIEHIDYNRPMYIGKLTLLHGDEYKGGGGINPARWLSLRAGTSAAAGHFHRTTSHVDRTLRGEIRGWWSIGCLCTLQPTWLPMNQWTQGFAIVDVNPDGSFEFDNKMIIDGKVR